LPSCEVEQRTGGKRALDHRLSRSHASTSRSSRSNDATLRMMTR
jgi:hypothetical protein